MPQYTVYTSYPADADRITCAGCATVLRLSAALRRDLATGGPVLVECPDGHVTIVWRQEGPTQESATQAGATQAGGTPETSETGEIRARQVEPPTGQYGGWPTRETWKAHLHLSNNQDLYTRARKIVAVALGVAHASESESLRKYGPNWADAADRLKEWVEEGNPLAEEGSDLYGDLLTTAIGRIDYHALAHAFAPEHLQDDEEEA